MYAYRTGIAILATLLGATLAPSPARAQAPTPVKVTITIGGRTETLRGTGSCGHEPRASIYGVPAALWTVRYQGTAKQFVSLSFWRPAAAGAEAQFSLMVQNGASEHRINTIKGSDPEGSGRSTLQATALGGRFEITGKDQKGVAVQTTIECARFSGIEAVGG